MQFRDRVALVTGAASKRGMGRAIALHLAKHGVNVAVADIDEAGVEEAAEAVREAGTEAVGVQTDVSKEASVIAMAETVVKSFGRIDILVNNAGITQPRKILDITETDWDRILSVNLKGAFRLTAVLGSAGLPLTRHGQRRSFAVTTARVEGGRVSESFPRADSLVILTGVTVLDQVMSRLLADGWPPETPASIVERGTLAWERQISGPLGRLSGLAERASVASPALVVVGEAARAIPAIVVRPPQPLLSCPVQTSRMPVI